MKRGLISSLFFFLLLSSSFFLLKNGEELRWVSIDLGEVEGLDPPYQIRPA
jgi:hypothetical protein